MDIKEADNSFYMTNREDQQNSIQNSSDITKEIVCTIIKNSGNEMNLTKEEAITISQIYEIIYKKVENLKRVSTTYKKPTKLN